MPGFLKKTASWIGKSVAGLLLLFLAYLAYGMYAENVAEKKAAAMCASVQPGQDAAPLRNRALADGAFEFATRWIKDEKEDALHITYMGLPPFSRYTCIVTARNGKVISARQFYLD